MSHTGRQNSFLRHNRLARGWSLRRVADEIRIIGVKENGKEPGVNADMVGEWERGIKIPSPYYREKLCQIYNATANQLGFLADTTASSIRESQPSMSGVLTGNNDMNKKRRELLNLLSLASATLVLPFPDLDWERIEDVLIRQSQVDEDTLRDLETMNVHYWSIYRMSSSKGLVLDGVLKQLKMLVDMLKVSHPSSQHDWLCRVTSDLSQLAGEIFFDVNDYDAAQSCYVFSATAAKEAAGYDLWACALIRHSFLPIFDEQYTEALPLLHQAKRLAQRGDQSLSTRFWVEAVSADAQSGIGNLTSCQRALDIAQGVLTMQGKSSNGGWLRFDDTRLLEQRGACYVNLGQPYLAIPALQEALTQQGVVSRRRAIILTNLAKVALQQNEIEHACDIVGDVIDIAIKKPSGVISKGIYSLSTQLTPHKSLQVVKNLNQRMKLLV